MTDATTIADVVKDTPHATQRVQDAIEGVMDTARDARTEAVRVEAIVDALGAGAFKDIAWVHVTHAVRESMVEAARVEAALDAAARAAWDARRAARAVADIVVAHADYETP